MEIFIVGAFVLIVTVVIVARMSHGPKRSVRPGGRTGDSDVGAADSGTSLEAHPGHHGGHSGFEDGSHGGHDGGHDGGSSDGGGDGGGGDGGGD